MDKITVSGTEFVVRLTTPESLLTHADAEKIRSAVEELQQAQKDGIFLDFLSAVGVDNWEGYDLAVRRFNYFMEHNTMDGYEEVF